MIDVDQRVREVRDRIASAAARAGREPSATRILAISKRHPAAVITAAYAAGIRDVGENFAQEMVAKLEELGASPECPGGRDSPEMRWHFVGKLQRNKAKQVIGRAALIHAVDSLKLAQEIDKRASAAGVIQPILIAVNVAGEDSKSGVSPVGAEELLAAVESLSAVVCKGFMTMPPLVDEPEENRAHFAALRRLRDRLATGARPLETLSMGTTGDYEVAVEEGATLVRVGTAIFGPRPV